MKPSDTSPEAAAPLPVELYRQMTPGQKLLRVFEAYRAGKAAGDGRAGDALTPRPRPGNWTCSGNANTLGQELFTEVYGQHIAQQLAEMA